MTMTHEQDQRRRYDARAALERADTSLSEAIADLAWVTTDVSAIDRELQRALEEIADARALLRRRG